LEEPVGVKLPVGVDVEGGQIATVLKVVGEGVVGVEGVEGVLFDKGLILRLWLGEGITTDVVKLLLFVLCDTAILSWEWTLLCVLLWLPINAIAVSELLSFRGWCSPNFPSDLFLNNISSVVGGIEVGIGRLPDDTLSFLDLNFLNRKLVLVAEEDNLGVPLSDNLLVFPLGNNILNPLVFEGVEGGGSSGLALSPTCNLASRVEFPLDESRLSTPGVSSSSSVIDPILSVLLLLVREEKNVRPLIDISVLALLVSFALVDCVGCVMSWPTSKDINVRLSPNQSHICCKNLLTLVSR